MKEKRVFVTVGTTKFDKLIQTVSSPDILNHLLRLGYSYVQFQTGNSNFQRTNVPGLTTAYETYFDDFDDQIERANLIISHGGAGTCLEVLRKNKPLIIVINDSLMDNHQTELAEQLEEDGYLYQCMCHTLEDTLKKDLGKLKPYSKPQNDAFKLYLDKCMGYS